MDENRNRDQHQPTEDGQVGVDGVFRGLRDLLRFATDLAERAEGDRSAGFSRGGSIGLPKKMHAVYGVSVRMGPRGVPSIARFGNVRRNARDEPVVDDEREPMVDVLDEEDHFVVVVELPGVEAAAVRWELRDDCLLEVSAASRGRTYRKETRLSCAVDERTVTSCYENGVLELKLWKRR